MDTGERTKKVFNKACALLKCALSDVFIAKQTRRKRIIITIMGRVNPRSVRLYCIGMYCMFILAKGTTLLSEDRMISADDIYIYIGKRSLSLS